MIDNTYDFGGLLMMWITNHVSITYFNISNTTYINLLILQIHMFLPIYELFGNWLFLIVF